MKAIMISIKPQYCALIMNGDKTIEVRKNKALASAIQKLINENGYADIYVYCTKERELYKFNWGKDTWYESFKHFTDICSDQAHALDSDNLDGKVVFKFRCCKIDDYVNGRKWSWEVGAPMWGACNDHEYILKDTCLTDDGLRDYANDLSFVAIHISNLEIFYPREIYEFHKNIEAEPPEQLLCSECGKPMKYYKYRYLTKAPQNFCYIDIEEEVE